MNDCIRKICCPWHKKAFTESATSIPASPPATVDLPPIEPGQSPRTRRVYLNYLAHIADNRDKAHTPEPKLTRARRMSNINEIPDHGGS